MTNSCVSSGRISIAVVSLGWMLTLALPLQAGTSRLIGLGGETGYVTDASDVLHWYSTLVKYPNRVDYELGDLIHEQNNFSTSQGLIGHGGGVHYRLGNEGRWGTAGFYFEDHLANGETDGAFSALWSRNLGPVQVGFGGRFTTFGESTAGTEVGDRINTQYFHQYGFGAGGVVRTGLRIEAAGEIINSLAEKSGALYHLERTNDWSTFGLRVRAFYDVTPTLTLVPLIDHFKDQRSAYNDMIGGPANLDARMTRLGIGANLRPDQDTLLLLSCEYRFGRENLHVRSSEADFADWEVSLRDFYQIRCRAGVESAILPWLTTRAALRYVRIHDDLNRSVADKALLDTAIRVEAVATSLAMGLTLRHGQVRADFAYNDTAPFNPGLASEGMFSSDHRGYSALTLGWVF